MITILVSTPAYNIVLLILFISLLL